MALTIYLIAETISHGIASYNHKRVAEQLRTAANAHWSNSGVPAPLRLNQFDSPLRETLVGILDPDQKALNNELMEKNQSYWIESQSPAELAELQLEHDYTDAEKDALFSQLVYKYATESQSR